jgi:glycolate dehydrogenase FAD-binding subunit
MATAVLEPGDAKQVASMLVDAGRQGTTIVPRGSGTKLEWATHTLDPAAYLSTKRLNAPVEHFAGDLVATIPAGAMLASANGILAQAGQWLPFDPCRADCATIGGIVAANDSGPRRHKYGSPRDLIIGVEIALSDGRIAKAGGRVVKNVAGYDLSRLVCGSFGSLGVITSATFKLAPLPAASRTVIATCATVTEAAGHALTVAALPVTPSALEIEALPARLLVRYETTERAADQMASMTRSVLEGSGASITVVADDAERDLWNQHESSIWDRPGLVAKISVLPTDVADCLGSIAAVDSRLVWSAIGRAALGVLFLRIENDADHSALTRLRQHIAARNGSLIVVRGSATAQAASAPESDRPIRAVMNAVKARFDPNNVLPPLPSSA